MTSSPGPADLSDAQSAVTVERRGHLLLIGSIGSTSATRSTWWTTPLVAAVQGWLMTLAIELLLAADIRIAASDARFAQLEIRRGIYAFGGATVRLPRESGWGNAMRWLLTGEEYGAAEAYRIGALRDAGRPGRPPVVHRAPRGEIRRTLRTGGVVATRPAPACR